MGSQPVYDVIVVGSGAAGGIAAYVLATRGLNVLCLEAGRGFLAGWLPAATRLSASPQTHPNHGAHHPAATEPGSPYVPQFFTPEEFGTVEMLTEIIIPTDDKPGAKEAQVANYIDCVVLVAAEFAPELQKAWTEGLALLERTSLQKHGARFREILPAARVELLTEMSLPERDPKAVHPGFDFYRLVKAMTVEGFYTSRVGLIDVLEYKGLDYLGEFPGCTHREHQT